MVEMLDQEILYNLFLPNFRQIMHLLESVKLFSSLSGLGKIDKWIAISASQTSVVLLKLKTEAFVLQRKHFCRAVKN